MDSDLNCCESPPEASFQLVQGRWALLHHIGASVQQVALRRDSPEEQQMLANLCAQIMKLHSHSSADIAYKPWAFIAYYLLMEGILKSSQVFSLWVSFLVI